jgi:hypothetical protein
VRDGERVNVGEMVSERVMEFENVGVVDIVMLLVSVAVGESVKVIVNEWDRVNESVGLIVRVPDMDDVEDVDIVMEGESVSEYVNENVGVKESVSDGV